MSNKPTIDMCNEFANKRKYFDLNPNGAWENFDPNMQEIINSSQWHEAKFIDEERGALHIDMSGVPNDVGGIYVFVLKPEIIPRAHVYIMYIGRAKHTTNQNLRKRCKEYFNDIRPKILMMREHWGKHLYIRYLPLDDNNIIDQMEKSLINAILPPCNDIIPDKTIMMAKKAAF